MGIFNFLYKPKSVNIKIDERTVITIHNKKEAEFYSASMLKIALDCANLVNTTKNPDVFFNRYNLLIEKMENLAKLEVFECFNGQPPSKNLEEILNKKVLTVNDFIDRYYSDVLFQVFSLKTQKAKQSRIDKFCNGLNDYKKYLSVDSLNKYNELCLKIKEEAEIGIVEEIRRKKRRR
mgnify:CR=1 FL=1